MRLRAVHGVGRHRGQIARHVPVRSLSVVRAGTERCSPLLLEVHDHMLALHLVAGGRRVDGPSDRVQATCPLVVADNGVGRQLRAPCRDHSPLHAVPVQHQHPIGCIEVGGQAFVPGRFVAAELEERRRDRVAGRAACAPRAGTLARGVERQCDGVGRGLASEPLQRGTDAELDRVLGLGLQRCRDRAQDKKERGHEWWDVRSRERGNPHCGSCCSRSASTTPADASSSGGSIAFSSGAFLRTKAASTMLTS